MAAVAFVAFLAVNVVLGKDIILKPIGSSGPVIGLLFIQGAQIPSVAYVPISQSIQTHLLNLSVTAWVGIPEFLGDVAEPLALPGGINRIMKALVAAGLPSSAPVFIAGHSLGGVSIQSYVSSHPKKFVAQILLGAYILRGQLQNGTTATATLTVGAELDGLSRVTRIAESFYHQIVSPKGNFAVNSSVNYPVTVVLGMTHMQFASGTPPALVKAKDLRPEITYDDAHTQAAGDISAFIAAHTICPQQILAASLISKRVTESGGFFDAIIQGFEMEGSYHLQPPCYDNPPSAACTRGSPWTAIAQVAMGGVSRPLLSFNVTDAFHPITALSPAHLPRILSNCTDAGTQCTLQMTTVSQAVYDALDATDTGLYPVSASEIRAELKSRQAVFEAAGLPADFNTTDTPSLCAQINLLAYEWALNASNGHTRQRYEQIGEPYVFGADLGPFPIGSAWIGAALQYATVSNATGAAEIEIRSPTARTSASYTPPAEAGMHYCKLLSPSRALEWIYVDSLRLHGSINATR